MLPRGELVKKGFFWKLEWVCQWHGYKVLLWGLRKAFSIAWTGLVSNHRIRFQNGKFKSWSWKVMKKLWNLVHEVLWSPWLYISWQNKRNHLL
jgi:hypothetical protein